ncbi:hypothetical protein H5410_060989 [Solanum commersonii]|uniref:Uncharacterized protein n=1 Tax=Solanum commersonii TaxID=4109 RepID=A0A9J5W7A5_SOLCO|nr:hypothetical protein H5410_060989 [Solanum commersonii]
MSVRIWTRAHPLRLNLMLTYSLGHQSSSLGFTTSLSSKPKTHGWTCFATKNLLNLTQTTRTRMKKSRDPNPNPWR